MKIEKLNLDGKKSSIEVLDKIFSGKLNKNLVENALYKINANYKGRHGKTKQQNEITGSTSKIYAQKGTGNARHASRKAPIFIGGGVAHGPKGQLAYKKRKLTKNEKKLSIVSLITEKNNLLYLKGSIPGSKNTEILVKKAVKNIRKLTMKEKIEAMEKAKKVPEKKKK